MTFLRRLFGRSSNGKDESSPSEALVVDGIRACAQMDFDRTIALCCQAISLEPNSPMAYYVRGTAIRNLTLGDQQESSAFLGLDIMYKADADGYV